MLRLKVQIPYSISLFHIQHMQLFCMSNCTSKNELNCIKFLRIVQEIPAKFARTHGRRLETVVKLQGIYKESPVCTVTCNWETATRLYLKDGWKKFGDEMLEVEQELEFTLTSDSFLCRERKRAR